MKKSIGILALVGFLLAGCRLNRVIDLTTLSAIEETRFDQLTTAALLQQARVLDWLDRLQTDLKAALLDYHVDHEGTPAATLLKGAALPIARDTAYEEIRRHFDDWMVKSGAFAALTLLDAEGDAVLSTDASMEGQNYAAQAIFQKGMEAFYVQSPRCAEAGNRVMIAVSRPIINAEGETLGVLVGYANLDALAGLMTADAGLGETGETYLVGADFALLTPSRDPDAYPDRRNGRDGIYVLTDATARAAGDRADGFGVYASYHGETVLGVYHWLPELGVALIAEMTWAEALGEW
jgi:hypothetical protein